MVEEKCCDYIPDDGKVCATRHSSKNDCGIWWCLHGCQCWQDLGKDCKRLNPAMMNLCDHAHSGWPITTTDTQHQAWMDETICTNCYVKQKDITVALGISTEQVHQIIHEMLGYRKLCVRCMSHACWHWKWNSANGRCVKNFWHNINRKAMPLSDKLSLTTSHGFIIMTPLLYMHKNSPTPKKFKVTASGGSGDDLLELRGCSRHRIF